jgi:hypothetical protein
VGGVVVENNDGEKDRWRLGEYLCDGIVMKSTAKKERNRIIHFSHSPPIKCGSGMVPFINNNRMS